MTWRSRAAGWLPPALVAAVASRGARAGLPVFDDRPGNWERAREASRGYADPGILERSIDAARAVRAGSGAFERDGVVFPEREVRWPVLAGILLAAAGRDSTTVVDVGGGLASTWWQHRSLLQRLPGLRWIVVEQPSVCEAGRALGDSGVDYCERLDDALGQDPAVVLLSSSLQYLADPARVVRSATETGAMLVIDRTPVHAGDLDLACVQTVPASIYPGSYPAWVLSAPSLDAVLRESGYSVLARFPGIEPGMRTTSGVTFTWEGLIAARGR